MIKSVQCGPEAPDKATDHILVQPYLVTDELVKANLKLFTLSRMTIFLQLLYCFHLFTILCKPTRKRDVGPVPVLNLCTGWRQNSWTSCCSERFPGIGLHCAFDCSVNLLLFLSISKLNRKQLHQTSVTVSCRNLSPGRRHSFGHF